MMYQNLKKNVLYHRRFSVNRSKRHHFFPGLSEKRPKCAIYAKKTMCKNILQKNLAQYYVLAVEHFPGREGWPHWAAAAARRGEGPPETTASTGIIPSVNHESKKRTRVRTYARINRIHIFMKVSNPN